jgi:hypothetical protein
MSESGQKIQGKQYRKNAGGRGKRWIFSKNEVHFRRDFFSHMQLCKTNTQIFAVVKKPVTHGGKTCVTC